MNVLVALPGRISGEYLQMRVVAGPPAASPLLLLLSCLATISVQQQGSLFLSEKLSSFFASLHDHAV